MAYERISVQLTTSSHRPRLDVFLDAFRQLYALLHEIDVGLGAGDDGSLIWRISKADIGHATIELETEPAEADYDPTADVIQLCLEGLQALQLGKEPPPDFPFGALKHARNLAGILTSEVSRISLHAPQGPTVRITSQLAGHVETMLGGEREAIGSVEGTMEAISVHRQPQFTLYETVGGGRVVCFFPKEMVPEVMSAFEQRVLVSGTVRYDRLGRPIAIAIDRKPRILRQRKDLPQAPEVVAKVSKNSASKPASSRPARTRENSRG